MRRGKSCLEKTEVLPYVDRILSLYQEMTELSELSPNPEVNALFTELVKMSVQILDESTTQEIMTDPALMAVLPNLRQICNEAECQLEAYWARRLLQHSCEGYTSALDKWFRRSTRAAWRQLEQFPYFDNYVELTRMELSALQTCISRPIRNIAFIGSGPLPLTSLCILRQLGKTRRLERRPIVTNIDVNQEALDLSKALCWRLGQRTFSKMRFVCTQQPSDNYKLDLRKFDVVYVASLVGVSQIDKERIILDTASRMRGGALVVIRSSWGLRKILYPEVNPTTIRMQKAMDICLVAHPYNSIVNSVIVGRVTT